MKTTGRITTIVSLVIVALVLVIYFIFAPIHKAEAPQSPEKKQIVSGGITISFEHQIATSTLSGKIYTTDIEKPVVSGLQNTDIERHINTQITDNITSVFSDFKDELLQWDVREAGDVSYLYISSTSTVVKNNFITIHSTVETYMAESAHPASREVTMNFDIKTGKLLSLDDVFFGAYLNKIADYCQTTLLKKFGPGSGDSTDENEASYQADYGAGFSADPENYKNFIIGDYGLTIVFDQYQVAAGYEGSQEVLVPWSELTPFLKSK